MRDLDGDLASPFQRDRIVIQFLSVQVVIGIVARGGQFVRKVRRRTGFDEPPAVFFFQSQLWSFRKIRFSKWGSLTETIIGLTENSEAGMTPEQLQQLLQLQNVRPALARLFQQGRLAREKMSGQFVYFPLVDASHRLERRREMESPMILPPLEQIIALLVEIIQRPQNSSRQWASRLARQQIRLSTEDIQAILEHYEIDQKKGLFTS